MNILWNVTWKTLLQALGRMSLMLELEEMNKNEWPKKERQNKTRKVGGQWKKGHLK